MTPTTSQLLANLREAAEGEANDGWRMVYLDNAQWPEGISSPRAFAGHLSALEKEGLYRPVDGYAWGEVRK